MLDRAGVGLFRAGVRRVQACRRSDSAAGGYVGDVEGQHLCRNSLLLLRRLLDGLVPLWHPEVGASHLLFGLIGQLTCTCHMCIGRSRVKIVPG